MHERIDEIRRETYRYYYQDGLVELAVGLLFLVIGVDTWLISATADGSGFSIVFWVLLPLLTVGGVFGVKRFVQGLKERLVYPRTGFVEYSTKPNPYRWFVIGGALLLALATLVLPYELLDKMSVVGGVILFIILASIGAQVDLLRLILTAAFALLAGIIFGVISSGEIIGLTLTFIVTGIALMISGGIGLRSYLAANPPVRGLGND